MERSKGVQLLIVAIPEAALAATLALFFAAAEPSHTDIPLAAWIICACYVGLMVIGLSTLGLRLPQWRRAPTQRAEAEVEAGEAQRGEARTGEAAAQAAARASDGLPLLAVPVKGMSSVRDAVLAFATQHGMRPYEADSGFVLADAQGQYYRVTAS